VTSAGIRWDVPANQFPTVQQMMRQWYEGAGTVVGFRCPECEATILVGTSHQHGSIVYSVSAAPDSHIIREDTSTPSSVILDAYDRG